MQQNNIKLLPIKENLDGELSSKIVYECCFCEKKTALYPDQRRICERLSGNQFFCNFCLQNGFYTKSNRNVLIMTFRGIIGFFYDAFYVQNKRFCFSQLEDYIRVHAAVGLTNPLFRYDPETYLWFVDFSRVGKDKKKIGIKEIHKTVANILAGFNLPSNMEYFKTSKLFEKYESAIDSFYTDRYRPENRKILCPTLVNCGGVCDHKHYSHEPLKDFKAEDLVMIR